MVLCDQLFFGQCNIRENALKTIYFTVHRYIKVEFLKKYVNNKYEGIKRKSNKHQNEQTQK